MPGVNWSEQDYLDWSARQNPRADSPKAENDQSEAFIQEECVKLMQEDGWRALRTDPVSDKSRGKGFGELGMPDYLFMRPTKSPRSTDEVEVIWVEFKSRNGKLASHQQDWHTKERARGFLTWIASVEFPASVEGFRAYYERSLLMRRARWW